MPRGFHQRKILYCHKCGCKVGEIARGKILRDVKITCKKCDDSAKDTGKKWGDMPGFFKDLFK
jgi:hypothetical protein